MLKCWQLVSLIGNMFFQVVRELFMSTFTLNFVYSVSALPNYICLTVQPLLLDNAKLVV